MACRAYFCDHRPDCEDLLCPGRPVTLHRVPGFNDQEGGKSVQGGFGVSLAMPLAEVPAEPIATPDKAEGWARAGQWFLVAVTLACLAAVAISYFDSLKGILWTPN